MALLLPVHPAAGLHPGHETPEVVAAIALSASQIRLQGLQASYSHSNLTISSGPRYYCASLSHVNPPIADPSASRWGKEPGWHFGQPFVESPDYKDSYQGILERSVFTLCPRGHGATTFRVYEVQNELQFDP